MNKLPIRIRLTLYLVLLLTSVCILLTGLSIYNANQAFVLPYLADASQAGQPPASLGEEPKIYMMPDADETADEAGAIVITQASKSFNTFSLWIMAAVILGSGVTAYLLLGRALKPLRRLSDEIGRTTENELSQPVGSFPSRDEISSLADSFNRMLTRLDKAFSDQKRFASDAAHELKTPLAAIKTNIDVLRLDAEPPVEEYEKTIRVIERQTARMTRLVDDLFAMISQRGCAFDDTVDFDAMFTDILVELAPRIRKKQIKVVLHPGGLQTTANSVMLTQAFSNLVENAVKYNVEGGRIDIATKTDGKCCTITISDNGIGIPPEKIEHIFKPFYRADASRAETEGAGLGLAITSEIIGRHGGSISAQSRNGETIFTVTLPMG